MSNWRRTARPKSSRPIWPGWPCSYRAGASPPNSCAGSTSRLLPRTARRWTCCGVWARSRPTVRTASAPTARPWPNCRRIRASPTCCCAARTWGWPTWLATSPHCSVNATFCAAAVLTCTVAWPCSAAKPAQPKAGRAACSAPGNWLASTVVICVAKPLQLLPTLTIPAGWAPCWRWPIRTGSANSGVPAVRNIGWLTAVPRCSAKPMP
ncbi:hypothetical protein D3C80_1079600 [compost metagenome]